MIIAIYDDSLEDIAQMTVLIQKLMKKLDSEYELKIINNSQELIDLIEYIDILFLDIELRDDNGISLGLKLKNVGSDCRIIITSKYQKYLIDGYKIRAERYFIKPINEKEFFIEMETVIEDYFYKEYGFIDEKISRNKIYIKNIMYIEYIDKHTILYCQNHSFKTPYPLKYWIEKLQKFEFGQCYKSILINLNYLSYIDKIDIVLKNGMRLPVSRHFKNDLSKKFIESLGKRL